VWHKDKTDMSDALGYHDVQNNLPFAVVGVEDDIATGNEISTTVCHEIDEMLVDPFVNRMGPTIGDKQYIIETDDAVEEDGAGPFFPGADGKPIRLSNSVTPAYFISGSPGPWDMAGMLTGPIPDQLPGGYLGWRSVRSGAWGQDVMRKLDGAYSTRSQRAFGRTWRRTQGDASLLAPHPLLLRMGMPT
jgi:hypothetical protein